jgi:hypothetical protein
MDDRTGPSKLWGPQILYAYASPWFRVVKTVCCLVANNRRKEGDESELWAHVWLGMILERKDMNLSCGPMNEGVWTDSADNRNLVTRLVLPLDSF